MILLLSVFPLLLLSDGVKHSDMRKVYVNLLCGGFTMLCAFFVYHDLGNKGSDNLGRERFDIDELFCESYEMLHVVCGFFQMLNLFFKDGKPFGYLSLLCVVAFR